MLIKSMPRLGPFAPTNQRQILLFAVEVLWITVGRFKYGQSDKDTRQKKSVNYQTHTKYNNRSNPKRKNHAPNTCKCLHDDVPCVHIGNTRQRIVPAVHDYPVSVKYFGKQVIHGFCLLDTKVTANFGSVFYGFLAKGL